MHTVSDFTRSARSAIYQQLGNTSVDQPTVISIESEQISRSARHDYSLTFSDLDKSILVVKLYLGNPHVTSVL